MKIAIVTSRLCYGGAEHVGVLLANGFYKNGHEVFLLSDTNLPISFQIDGGVQVKGVYSQVSSKSEKWFRAVLNLRKEIKRIRPNIVLGIAETCSLVSKLACVGLKIPVVYTAHNSFERPETAPMGLWNKIAKFKLGRVYDATTVLTEADKKCIGKKLCNVFVMPNPLGLQPVDNIPQKQNIIFAVGRLDGWHVKGLDVLIRAWARVVSSLEFQVSTEGWKLQIAGTGSEESLNYLKQLCKENGVEDSVEFLGFRKDVEKLYQDASIFVLSSRYEGFGLVLIEAMSQGCACVACDYKGRQREIIAPEEDECLDSFLKFQDSSVDGQKESEDTSVSNSKIPQRLGTSEKPDAWSQGTLYERSGERTRNLNPETRNLPVEACETGILCEPDNVEALAEAMAKMITDDEYRESVRKNAIERSNFYSMDNTIERWESLLDKVVNK